MTMQGKIENAFMDRGFGFIIPDDGGVNIYFHRSGIQPDTFAQLSPGRQVSYEVRAGKQGKLEAFNLTLESAKSPNQPKISDPLVAPPTATLVAHPTVTLVAPPTVTTAEQNEAATSLGQPVA